MKTATVGGIHAEWAWMQCFNNDRFSDGGTLPYRQACFLSNYLAPLLPHSGSIIKIQ